MSNSILQTAVRRASVGRQPSDGQGFQLLQVFHHPPVSVKRTAIPSSVRSNWRPIGAGPTALSWTPWICPIRACRPSAGKNLEKGGGLNRFLEMAKSGQLGENPVLLIEDFDRFSRASPIDVFPMLLQDVVGAGITLQVLSKSYSVTRTTLTKDQGLWHRLVADINAAHDFSQKLSRRVLSAKQKEREDIAAGVVRRKGVTPFWLSFDEEAGQFVEIKAWADLVRRVFALAIDKEYGCGRIARILNEEGKRTATGKPFQTSTIHKLITNPAAMGKIQPQRSVTVMVEERGEMVARRRSVDAGEMVERYPAVIDPDRWHLCQERMKSRTKTGGARRQFRSALQGLVTDLATGEQLSYVPAMPRPGFFYEYLRPGHTNSGTPKAARNLNYQDVLATVLTGLGQTTWESFFTDADDDSELAAKLTKRKELEADLAAMKSRRTRT